MKCQHLVVTWKNCNSVYMVSCVTVCVTEMCSANFSPSWTPPPQPTPALVFSDSYNRSLSDLLRANLQLLSHPATLKDTIHKKQMSHLFRTFSIFNNVDRQNWQEKNILYLLTYLLTMLEIMLAHLNILFRQQNIHFRTKIYIYIYGSHATKLIEDCFMPLGQLWHTTAGQVFLCLQHFKHFGRGSLVLKTKPADRSGSQQAGLTFTGCPSRDGFGADGQVKTLSLLHLKGDGWGRDGVFGSVWKKINAAFKIKPRRGLKNGYINW